MLCPGCGFENESDNKFCNMCGMALPAGDSANPPAEREPLDLDLSLDLSLDDANGSADGLNLDLSAADNSGFDLNTNLDSVSGASNQSADDGLDFSLPTVSDDTGLNLDLNASPDLNFDTAASGDNNGLNLDLDSESQNLDLNFNTEEAPGDTFNIETPSEAEEDPFAAPEGFDLNTAPASELPEAGMPTEPMVEAITADAPVAYEEPAQEIQEFNFEETASQGAQEFNFEESSTDQSAGFGIDSDTASTESFDIESQNTASSNEFDFGDLDSQTATVSAPEESTTEEVDLGSIGGDDDLSSLIVSSNDDFSTPEATTESISFDDESSTFDTSEILPMEEPAATDSDDDFMNSLIISSTDTPASTQKPKATATPTAPVNASPRKQASDDEDLNNLLRELDSSDFEDFESPATESVVTTQPTALADEEEDYSYLGIQSADAPLKEEPVPAASAVETAEDIDIDLANFGENSFVENQTDDNSQNELNEALRI